MDSPLNLAHQQARRADVLVRSGKFEDATDCHKRAAEYLLESMQLTSSEHALQSLQLQHQHHLRQHDLILERCHRIERARNAQRSAQNRTNQSCQTDTLDLDVDLIDGNMSPHHFEASLYPTMNQTDTLLAFLYKRSNSQDSSSSRKTPTAAVAMSRAEAKEEQVSPAELRSHNDELQKHVRFLVKELVGLRRENEELALRLHDKDNMKHGMSDQIFNDEHFTPFELPPLEMPTLSLDLMKEGLQADDALSDDEQLTL